MNRAELEHILRACKGTTEETEFIVIGSQAILGRHPDAPRVLRYSMELLIGWRRGQALMGKPDFVFRRERVAVFVDGCFWHGCPKPKHAPLPKNNADW